MKMNQYQRYICLLVFIGTSVPLEAASWSDSASGMISSISDRVSVPTWNSISSRCQRFTSAVAQRVRSAPFVAIGAVTIVGASIAVALTRVFANKKEQEFIDREQEFKNAEWQAAKKTQNTFLMLAREKEKRDKELDDLKRRCDALKGHNRNIDEERIQLKNDNEFLSDQNRNAMLVILELKSRADEYQGSLDRLSKKLLQQVEKLETKTLDLTKNYEKEREEHKKARFVITELQRSEDASQESSAIFASLSERSFDIIEEMRAQNQKLMKMYEQEQDEHTRAKKRIKELTRTIKNSEPEEIVCGEELQNLESQLALVNAKKAEIRKELYAIDNEPHVMQRSKSEGCLSEFLALNQRQGEEYSVEQAASLSAKVEDIARYQQEQRAKREQELEEQLRLMAGGNLELERFKYNTPQREGEMIYKKLLDAPGEASDLPSRLQSIADFMHYLYKFAENNGQGFTQGAFLVEDCQGHIYNFLNNHPDAYDRDSSHLVDYFEHSELKEGANAPKVRTNLLGVKVTEVRGLNMIKDVSIFNPLGYGMLPEGKRHIFFMRVGDYTFIKPEDWETSWAGIIPHGYEYILSRARKKYVLQPYVGTDDEPYYRKERVPEALLKQYHIFLDAIPDQEQVKNWKSEAKIYGISRIVKQLNQIINQFSLADELTQKAQAILSSIEREYDHLDVRIGREVIISYSEADENVRPKLDEKEEEES